MTVDICMAFSNNGVYGVDGGLPWSKTKNYGIDPDDFRRDMKRFSRVTKDGIVVVGRRTWEAFGGPHPLPGRKFVLVSSDPFRARYVAEDNDIIEASSGHFLAATTRRLRTLYPERNIVVGGGISLVDAFLDLRPFQVRRFYMTTFPFDVDAQTTARANHLERIRDTMKLEQRIITKSGTHFDTWVPRPEMMENNDGN